MGPSQTESEFEAEKPRLGKGERRKPKGEKFAGLLFLMTSSTVRAATVAALIFVGALLASQARADSPTDSGGANHGSVSISLLVAFGVLLFISAFAAGAETAVFSLNKLDVLQIRKRGSPSNRALLYLLDNPNDTLITLLALNNFVNAGLSLIAGALTESYFSGLTPLSFSVAALGATIVILVFGEVLPKCVAHVKARPMAQAVAWPTAAMSVALTPVRRGINAMVHVAFEAMGISQPKPTERISEEELKAVMSAGEVSTLLEEDELGMIEGVFELRHTFAEEIMIPRPDVAAFPDDLSQEDLIARLRELPRSRVLIYHESLDHPAGFLLVKEILLNPQQNWREKIREPLLLPLKVRLLDLLKRFRKHSSKMAVLVDEYGGVAGIVTLHDLLEEIVGDITERHEPVIAELQTLGPNHWRVSGQMNLDELGRELGTKFPDDMGTTIGGYVMNALGRVPTLGETLDHDGMRLKVAKMTGRRIILLEIHGTEPDSTQTKSEEKAAV